MKTNTEILEMTKGYTMINSLFGFMVVANGKNIFIYKEKVFETYNDNMCIDNYWVFFNTTNKKCLLFKKN